MNKYTIWYTAITDRARTRKLNGYTERHHILPRSLNGTDDKNNLVDLTAREHFICHWLLTKMYTGEAKAKMIYALNGMKRSNTFAQRYKTKITARVYENLKKEFSAIHSTNMKGRDPWNKGVPITEEQREKNRIAATGKKRSAEAIAKTVAKQTGQKRSQETKDKIRDALKGKTKGPMSAEGKRIRSESAKGVPKPPGHTEKRLATLAKQIADGTHYSQQKKSCPHCGVIASKGPYTRYHGDQCRARINI
jgi:hypothetical protein